MHRHETLPENPVGAQLLPHEANDDSGASIANGPAALPRPGKSAFDDIGLSIQ